MHIHIMRSARMVCDVRAYAVAEQPDKQDRQVKGLSSKG